MKPYDTGLICGRFQTFHKGHERLVESGLLLCDRLLILIGSTTVYRRFQRNARKGFLNLNKNKGCYKHPLK